MRSGDHGDVWVNSEFGMQNSELVVSPSAMDQKLRDIGTVSDTENKRRSDIIGNPQNRRADLYVQCRDAV